MEMLNGSNPKTSASTCLFFYPCSKVVEIPLSTTSTEISIYPNQDELGNLRPDRPWMEDRMICMLFQMVVKSGNFLHYPTNVHFNNVGVNTGFTPKTKSYNDYFFYINKHKLGPNPTNELTEIKFTGMRTQNNVSIFCSFQFAVLPLMASDEEIYDVRFYNKVIKAQQTKINNPETELSSIKLSFDQVFYCGPYHTITFQQLYLNKRHKLNSQGQASSSIIHTTTGYDSKSPEYIT